MAPEKAITASPVSEKSYARRSVFPLRAPFRQSDQKQSGIDTPICEERHLYDVYDPQNPKHNPSAKVFSRQESHTSLDSQKQPNWVHDLPRKSIHKARSGILALKAGLNLRRPRDSATSSIETNLERQQASSVSTQEDLGFGVDLYRTNVPWPPSEDEPSVDILMRTASFHPLINIASAPEVLMRPRRSIEDPEQENVLFRRQIGTVSMHVQPDSPTKNRDSTSSA